MRLRILLGDHPHTAALKSGAIISDLVELDFAEIGASQVHAGEIGAAQVGMGEIAATQV